MAAGPGLDSCKDKIFLFRTAFRPPLGPIQWVPRALSLELKWQGREADRSYPSCAEVKKMWNYSCTPSHDSMASVSLSLSLLLLPFWSIGHPWSSLFHFSFLILRQSVEPLGRGISPSQGRYLHSTTQIQSKRRETSMPWVWTHDTSVRASEERSCLTPRDHCDQHFITQCLII
jgi:hypothetical protein